VNLARPLAKPLQLGIRIVDRSPIASRHPPQSVEDNAERAVVKGLKVGDVKPLELPCSFHVALPTPGPMHPQRRCIEVGRQPTGDFASGEAMMDGARVFQVDGDGLPRAAEPDQNTVEATGLTKGAEGQGLGLLAAGEPNDLRAVVPAKLTGRVSSARRRLIVLNALSASSAP
jgi:hypothetical protein